MAVVALGGTFLATYALLVTFLATGVKYRFSGLQLRVSKILIVAANTTQLSSAIHGIDAFSGQRFVV